MATTRIADVLTPANWNAYGRRRTAELSALWQSGIVGTLPGITLPAAGGTINLPYWNDLTGVAETLRDGVALTPDKITAGAQRAVVCGEGKAWAISGLARYFAGSDPARALLDAVAGFWARQDQRDLFNVLAGVFSAGDMAPLIHNIGGTAGAAGVISANALIDAGQKLGDAKGQLTALAMHSAVEAALAKQDLIAYVTPSGSMDRVPFYMGKRVIVDDACPVSGGIYTSFLFGPGVIGYDEGVIGDAPIETDRDILVGDDYVTMRRRFIMHPQGMKWNGAVQAGDFPTPAEMATAANWTRVADVKQIPIVAVNARIA